MKNQFYFAFRLLFILVIIIQLSQCRKDETETNIIESTIVDGNEDVSFIIVVVDENGELISDASVSLANEILDIQPNAHGVYILKDIEIADIGRRISVSKEGFFPQLKMLTGESQSKNTMEIILTEETESILITTGEANTIDGGGELLLPSHLINEQGESYTGPVRVKSLYFDPDNSEYIQQAPGNMTGLNAKDEYVLLGSLGMYYVNLSHPETGEKLNIPTNSTATLSFPIADNQKDEVPSSIPLWSLDEDSGIWNYEGEATLQNDMMVAQVSHFSFWNCDLPYSFVPFCAIFINGVGSPVAGLEVDFFINNLGFGNDITDNRGILCGKLPIESLIDLTFSYGNVHISNQQIGPFVNTPIDITIDVSTFSVFGSTVDCDQLPLVNGYGIVTANNSPIPLYIESDGTFEYFLTSINHDLLLVNQADNAFAVLNVEADVESKILGVVEVCNEMIVGSISGSVMLDVDEDGSNLTPIKDATINARNKTTGEIDYTAKTDVDGRYSIDAIPMIEYELFVSDLEDMKTIYQGDKSPEDGLPLEDWTNRTRVGIAARLSDDLEMDEDNDFQLVNSANGIVKGSVLFDIDGDNIGDSPATNISISIHSSTQGTEVIKVVQTDGNGDFEIETSNFIGELRIPNGSISDYDLTPDPDGDDQALGSNSRIPIRLKGGETDEDNNFITRDGEISGSQLEDTDNDGVGDSPIEGFEITLYGDFPELPRTTTTDENGYYIFTNVAPGEYYIRAQDEAEVDEDYVDVYDGDDSPEDVDDAVDGLDDDKIEVTLEPGEVDADNNFVEIQLGSISGNLSVDTDNDGVADQPGEGRLIDLHRIGGEYIGSITTDENGDYGFDGLPPADDYFVQYEVLSGFEIIREGDDSPEDANDAVDTVEDGIIFVTLEPGEDDEDNNFVDREL